MFDSTRAFTQQFESVEDGYVYYPSRKSGGKFVSTGEFEELLADWRRVSGTAGVLKVAGVICVAMLSWATLTVLLNLPEWAETLMMIVCVAAVIMWIGRAALAPRRLVKGRPDYLPPRTAAESRKAARGALTWPFVFSALFLTGILTLAGVVGFDGSISAWLWMLGPGALFGAYLCIVIQKSRDRPR